MLPRLASADPVTQLGGLAVTQGERWQCGQALGPSSLGGSTLLYPLGATKISYHYANVYLEILVWIKFGSWAQNRHCKNIGGYKFGSSVWNCHTLFYMRVVADFGLAVTKMDCLTTKFSSYTVCYSCLVIAGQPFLDFFAGGAVAWPVADWLELVGELSRIHLMDASSIPGWEATSCLSSSKKSLGGCSL